MGGIATPVLVNTCNGWVCSGSEEHLLILNFYNGGVGMNVTSRVIKGVGELTNITDCDMIANEFKIPARV